MNQQSKDNRMYSLSIHFGPNAMVWAFLFKEKEKAEAAEIKAKGWASEFPYFNIEDDFGQSGNFTHSSVHAVLLEDLDLVEEARILRSLANARGEVKARQRAATDPVIRTSGQGASVLQPRFNG
jgi:hypothetical protein